MSAPLSIFGAATQEKIVLAISAILFIVFSLTLDKFATAGNLLSLIQAVSIIGSLGIAMAIVVIGRGIDLSLIAVMSMPVAWFVIQVQGDANIGVAFALALGLAVAIGLLNGWLVAYAEVPGIFATIGTGAITYGAVQFFFVPTDVIPLPARLDWLSRLWLGATLGVPNTVIFFAGLAGVAALFLKYTRAGRFIFAIGENAQSARTLGISVRPIVVLQYTLAAIIGLCAGFVLVGTIDSANTRLFNSTMIYDVILVVVLGGIGLSGGKGGVRNVIAGTILIGILINGMTILNLPYVVQNLVRATILLGAILIDGLLNPRDEQISQQGDI